MTGRRSRSGSPRELVPSGQEDLTLEVYRLVRTGEVVELTLAAHNPGTDPLLLNTQFRAPGGTTDLSGVSLFDPAGLKRYLVLLDTSDRCLCSSVGGTPLVTPGGRAYLAARFPAPPEGTSTLTVETPVGSLVAVPLTEGA